MKHLSRILVALVLALTIAGTLPAQVFADSLPEYISEVKIFEGSYSAASGEGFKLLSDEKGNPIDLNQGSGATGIGAKGNKAVYLGYKTTTKRDEAITDLALMNMQGGYSVEEYEALMADQMKSQILPFIDNFMAAVKEYRENYNSGNEANQKKAQYVHDALNKLYDDDTEKLLGDLLLNKTKYEYGLEAYNKLSAEERNKTDVYKMSETEYEKLSDEEKKNCADLAVIIAQANGQATLIMESLITRAADTGEDTWLDRFTGITYEDLEDSLEMLPSDAYLELAQMYDDDAQEILEMWEPFRTQLDNYEKTVKLLKEEEAKDFSSEEAIVGSYDVETATDAETEAYAKASAAISQHVELMANYNADVFCHDLLDEIDYGDGTLLDFFTQSKADVRDDIKQLYPIVAALSDGQRAGLEFVTLQDLVMLGATDGDGYRNHVYDNLSIASIYLGVDREIYKKGGVALTSDALRSNIVLQDTPEKSYAGFIWGGIAGGLALAGIGALVASTVIRNSALKGLAAYNDKILNLTKTMKQCQANIKGLSIHMYGEISAENPITGNFNTPEEYIMDRFGTYQKNVQFPALDKATAELDAAVDTEYVARMTERSDYCRYMQAGAAVFTAIMVIASAVLSYLNYKEMKEYYNVDFTPIPHYMVDEKDITVFNANGDRVVIKNQSAYYKAVECNRKKGDSYFSEIDTCADMNGCVNPQWLALYAQKSEVGSPILADSLKAVVGDKNIPAGYKTGIHMFGSGAAFNLNSEVYCWNKSAKSVFVYYKVDTASSSSASAAGSNFTAGNLALAGAGGLAVGALISGIAASVAGKKKNKKAA